MKHLRGLIFAACIWSITSTGLCFWSPAEEPQDDLREEWKQIVGADVFAPIFWLRDLRLEVEEHTGCDIKVKGRATGIKIWLTWRF